MHPAPQANRSGQPVTDFFRGAGDVWRGLGFLLAHPALWLWALIPFILNIVFFFLVGWAGLHFFEPWLHQHFFAEHGFWMALSGWLLRALAWIVFLIFIVFLFVPLATLIAAPFNDILSEKVELIYAGARASDRFSLRELSRAVVVGLGVSLRLTLLTLALLACTLPLHLIAGFGSLLASVASAAITIWFLSLQFTAYSMDRRFYNFRQRREFLRHHRARAVGLGSMAFLIMLVPVLNALFIPVSAVAGTLLFCDARLGRK